MSLARALAGLPDDPALAQTLRDVLLLFRRHASEWLTETDVQTKTGGDPGHVRRLLPLLTKAFVLDFDSESDRYRYRGDIALNYEIDTFVRRVEYHRSHVQTNVARFRERYGS